MNIGDKIRKVRELKGYKQEYVAGKLGLSVTAYGNIERNESSLTFDRLEEIAEVLEVSVQDILNIPEQFNVHSIVNSQVGFSQSGFNYYAGKKNGNDEESELAAFKLLIENLQKENDYLRQQNLQLMELLNKKIS
ncbi:MAG TPA: helix-turn-helix transcriptional regulator [Flavisolibacter sp.]|jgi:transcriptional regulator with XRE-family HTH domain|nr:helix-turn-helix transcriptional regulator [Flavisolibacter sp.]